MIQYYKSSRVVVQCHKEEDMKHKKGFLEQVAEGMLSLVGDGFEVKFGGDKLELYRENELFSCLALEAVSIKEARHDPEMLVGFWFGNM